MIFVAYGPEGSDQGAGVLRIISGQDGADLLVVADPAYRLTAYAGLAVADIDGDGLIEIVAPTLNRALIAFEHDGTVKWMTPPDTLRSGGWVVGGASIADLDADGNPEIVYGKIVFDSQGTVKWQGAGAYTGNNHPSSGRVPSAYSVVADIDLDGRSEIVAGASAYSANGDLLWQSNTARDGFTAIGNFDQDNEAEIVIVSNRQLYMLDHLGNIVWGPVPLLGNQWGGPPTIGDMNGDGLPEIGVASGDAYTVYHGDGSVLWSSPTIDRSSGMTGSSVFDFDNDGQMEVVYADEYNFRIYAGDTGEILFEIPNISGTAYEYPVVVDVDNDEHADVLVVSNLYYPGMPDVTGIRAYSDGNNTWANTRSIWNQHTYHITNINADGSVPEHEQPSWLVHNTYRLNAFIGDEAALVTDLTTSRVVIRNGGVLPASISARIGNSGAAALTREVAVAFYEGDPANGGTLLGTVAVNDLAAGSYRDVTLEGVTALAGVADIYVIADYDNRVQECNEANNQAVVAVLPQTGNGAITVGTDADTYGPQSPVRLSGVVTNTSGIPGEFRAELRVEDAEGTLIQSYPHQSVGPVSGGGSLNLSDAWNTAGYQAGRYRLHGLLTDLDGVVIDEAESPFEIRHSVDNLPLAALRTTTDRPVYHTSDIAQLNNLVRNLSSNTQIRDAGLRIRVTDAAGDELFSHQKTLNELPSGAFRDTITPYGFDNAAEGIYTVTGELTDASGNLLATGQAQFEVQADLQKDLTGKVAAQLKIVERGQTQTCTDTLTNTGSQILDAQPLRQILANLDGAELVTQSDLSMTLQPGATESQIRSLETGALSEGEYACVLQAMIASEWITLGYDNFSLTVPSIEIEGTLEQAILPRLLVLLDESRSCAKDHDKCGHDKCSHDKNDHDCCDNSSDRDPNGSPNAPKLSEQRSYIEALLNSLGYNYTIVTDKEAFSDHFLSGTYNTYALFSEQVKLSTTLQKALREAVYSGDGLLVAGNHDQRNQQLTDALGIKYRGKQRCANVVEMSDTQISSPQELQLQLGENVIRSELNGATSAGRFLTNGCDQGSARGQHSKQENCNQKDFDHGVTIYGYGKGVAVHVGYDLLAEATLTAANSAHSDLIRTSLAAIQPQQNFTHLGGIVPVLLTLTNQGVATPGRAVIDLSGNLTLLDSSATLMALNDSLVWSFDLQQSEVGDLILWLQPLSDRTDSLVDVLIQTGSEPDFTDYENLSLSFVLDAAPLLADLLDELSTLSDQNKDYHAVQKYMQKAQRALDHSNEQSAFENMIKASDHLMKISGSESETFRRKLDEVIRKVGFALYSSQNYRNSND